MKETEILLRQTENVYKQTNTLLQSVPYEKWDIMPDIMETTVNWQVGHLIVSHYYHSVWVIIGMQTDLLQTLPLKKYGVYFTSGSPNDSIGRFNPNELFRDLVFIQQKSIEILSQLSDDILEFPLEPTGFPHPIAKNKREAIEWNIQHTGYHCGQLGMLIRVINKRFDYGLRL
ncbi:DinB family protein [Flavobacterium cerinum]|uniref:DinB family protein n=1 Tax=Flavobacterium cerinum TaxID=2502784 RepID=A0ABY5IMM2_9FLAO|nr:DinB family protein [Flavobacterium cerinum]UUC44086.1 DinB family protein [Flavobacterium cerinum]